MGEGSREGWGRSGLGDEARQGGVEGKGWGGKGWMGGEGAGRWKVGWEEGGGVSVRKNRFLQRKRDPLSSAVDSEWVLRAGHEPRAG